MIRDNPFKIKHKPFKIRSYSKFSYMINYKTPLYYDIKISQNFGQPTKRIHILTHTRILPSFSPNNNITYLLPRY